MAFEMSLPHAKRVKQLDGQGLEEQPADQDLWDLHAVVQRALQDRAAAAAGGPEEAGEEEDAAAAAHKPAVPNPQRVLEKLLAARGEVDVILDLITFVEQQQFLGLALLPGKKRTPEDFARDRALGLEHRKDRLKRCTARLVAGLEALQGQAEVSNRFLSEVAQLRRHWKLKRHSGKEGLFYVDLALPLAPSARKAVGEQPGAHWNLIQDTNGDVCTVDRRPGGKPVVVRSWRDIHAALECKQRVVTWHAVHALLAHEAQQAQQGKQLDPDGMVAAVLQLAAAARQEAADAAVAGPAAAAVAAEGTGTGAGPSDMEVDGIPGAAAAAAAGEAAESPWPQGGVEASMQSAAAADVRALLRTPGFQGRFRSRALLLLRGYLRGAERAAAAAAADALPTLSSHPSEAAGGGMLAQLVAWLRHSAASHRVEASLRRQVEAHNSSSGGAAGAATGAAAGQPREPGGSALGPLSLRALDSDSELVDAWQLEAPGTACPALVIVSEGAVRLEGSLGQYREPGGEAADGAAGVPPWVCRRVGRGELDSLLSLALSVCGLVLPQQLPLGTRSSELCSA